MEACVSTANSYRVQDCREQQVIQVNPSRRRRISYRKKEALLGEW
jgi:hypothetical protein